MPNTLAHIGVQGFLTRAAWRDADPKWIYFGCVIPDVPWITQRVALFAMPGIDPYALRFYLDVQASLFGCLLLCAAVSLLASQRWKMFAVLGSNVLMHLILDATQTKWANGVHLFAPFSWKLTNWGFYWPESLITYTLTAAGLGLFIVYWRTSVRRPLDIRFPDGPYLIGFIIFILAYFIMPVFLLRGPEKADNHYMATLRDPQSRAGRYAEFDRAHCRPADSYLRCFGSEDIRVTGIELERPATISLRGTFVSENEFRVSDSHIHVQGFRNNASYLGLALIVVLWVVAWIRSFLSVTGEPR